MKRSKTPTAASAEQPLLSESYNTPSNYEAIYEGMGASGGFEPMPSQINFTSEQTNGQVSEWLCLEQLTSTDRVLSCFHTSNTIELQERMNALTNRKDLWFPEFLEFLGIKDERVLMVCANDHIVAMEANRKEFKQVKNSAMSNSSKTTSQYLVTENPFEFRRMHT